MGSVAAERTCQRIFVGFVEGSKLVGGNVVGRSAEHRAATASRVSAKRSLLRCCGTGYAALLFRQGTFEETLAATAGCVQERKQCFGCCQYGKCR